MFLEATDGGSIDVQLVYFRGLDECRMSGWVSGSATMLSLMSKIHCQSGETQIGKVLAHAISEKAKGRVDALVFIGDAFEEDAGKIFAQAKVLAGLKLPIFLFQEGNNPEVKAIFEEIARLTGGAYAPFSSDSARQLGELLKAVATFARGGATALAADKSEGARLLLGQIKS